MSTSGIIIMIVLLLTLELVERESKDEQSMVETVDIAEISAEVQTTEEQIENLQQQLEQTDQIIQTASTLSPGDLSRQIRNLNLQNDELERSVSELNRQWKTTSLQQGEMSDELKKLLETRKALADLNREESKLKTEIDTVVTENRPVFSFPQTDRHSGWLVVVSKNKFEAAPLEKASRPIGFKSRSSFLRWIGSQKSTAKFFLVVRPDGIDTFDRIREQFDRSSVRYGFDLTGQNQVILNADRGAGQ